MRIALVHYWLVRERGGEKVLKAIHDLYPDATIFTNVHDPARTPMFDGADVRTGFVQKLPFAKSLYQNYLPFMPSALEAMDLSEYDLVISSESGPAKGVVTKPGSTHICYVHSPMRYIWNMYPDYLKRSNVAVRAVFPFVASYMRMWDVSSSQRVDHIVCNSHNVATRVRRYWNRGSDVIHPPVDIDAFRPSSTHDGFYLYVGELVDYKRADILIDAFAQMKRRLVVIGGGGKDTADLEKRSNGAVTFLGRVDQATLAEYYARCRAVMFAADEDFGIVPLEAMASGKPVIAFDAGGARETVIHGKTGMFFPEQTPEAVIQAVEAFEASESKFDYAAIRAHAETFATPVFKAKFKAYVERALNPGSAKVQSLPTAR
jgi:glycosyltransferase involved in cell wall biosynthesis